MDLHGCARWRRKACSWGWRTRALRSRLRPGSCRFKRGWLRTNRELARALLLASTNTAPQPTATRGKSLDG